MEPSRKNPEIIQGGMGIGVSNWRLARAVAREDQMGVVSGTAIDSVFVRRLQSGDVDGSLRRALARFPRPDMARRILDKYFVPGGKPPGAAYLPVPKLVWNMEPLSAELLVVSNFVEVFLAKEGHAGLVGINYMEKIRLATLPSLLGAMLAGVDYVLMGAGIPSAIPGVLDGLARWEAVELKLQVEGGGPKDNCSCRFDPAAFASEARTELTRPRFLAVVSSDVVARSLARKTSGVDGFVVENHTAGGHNAPPRKCGPSSSASAPGYGPKDAPDIGKIRGLERPFWLAGGYASPAKLKEARDLGAGGIQVGTAFAFCRESGIRPEIKEEVLRQYLKGELEASTDFRASPTGYPFKIITSLKNVQASRERKRLCDLGYLRQLYRNGNSEIGYRCPAEPVKSYLAKGGAPEETDGKQCLCNGLMATIGLGQSRKEGEEAPIVTAGEDFSFVEHVLGASRDETAYGAKDVIRYLLD